MQKGSALIPTLLLGVAIIIISGFYYYSQSNRAQNSIYSPKIDNKNLEIYTNNQLGLEFKYSKNLKVIVDSEEEFDKRGNGEFRKNFTNYVTYPPAEFIGGIVVLDETSSYETNPLTIWVFSNSNNLEVEQFYENYWYYPFVWGDYTLRRNDVAPVNEATISGMLAKSGVVDYQPGKPKFAYLSKGRKMYLFRVIGESGDKILQTVKL